LKLIAVASAQRMASLAEVPAIAESLPGFESVTWYAVAAPPHTPAAVVDKVNAGMNEALRDPEVQKRLAELSAEAIGGTPQQAATYLKAEAERWKNVITAAHVTLD
jgi:tripartite-type tricarboxylate transporter receptor subunit TctC